MRSTVHQARRDDRGFVIPMTALVLIPLLVVAAFAVDVGGWYAEASRVQRAADAAALAGVVWMPNSSKAEEVALETAERNGFRHDPAGTGVVVEVSSPGEQRLMVRITAQGETFLGGVVRDDPVDITREATAEYALPVPLGSPRNFLGTGTLDTGFADEEIWLAVNAWCTDKVDGDRHQSRYSGNRSTSPYFGGSTSDSDCPQSPSPGSSILNTEYRESGYELYIEAPVGRSRNIDVQIYHPHYTGSSPDDRLNPGEQAYTFRMYAADNTPLDDSDNPPLSGCTKTYRDASDITNDWYLGTPGWDRFCTISTGMPSGRYILRVTNEPGARFAAGSNAYSVVARYQGEGLCDGRHTADCPRVYGKDAVSVFADSSAEQADFYLAEISPLHAGKVLQITLFDPGEGGRYVRIRRPTGSNSWANARFDWESSDGESGSDVTELAVRSGSSDRFNGEALTLTVDLSGYSPPASNRWWQVQYEFAGQDVTDRTTWSVVIIGDPVHLID